MQYTQLKRTVTPNSLANLFLNLHIRKFKRLNISHTEYKPTKNPLWKTWVLGLAFGILHYVTSFIWCWLQGHSQDLNRPLQDIVQNFGNDLIIIILTTLSWRQGKHEKFQVLRHLVKNTTYRRTVWSIAVYCTTNSNLQKIPKSIYLYSEQYFVCPSCMSCNKTATFGCLIDMGVA